MGQEMTRKVNGNVESVNEVNCTTEKERQVRVEYFAFRQFLGVKTLPHHL